MDHIIEIEIKVLELSIRFDGSLDGSEIWAVVFPVFFDVANQPQGNLLCLEYVPE